VPTSFASPASRLSLAASITRSASRQTYFTVRLLADRALVADAYRAYAYFRWLDDQLDQGGMSHADRLAFAARQQSLIERCCANPARNLPSGLSAEELMLVDLIHDDTQPSSGLQSYIRNMMNVMVFDAERRGRLITARELAVYTDWLAVAVTEALHHFIGHACAAPRDDSRYRAATAAHIAHMLRDTVVDTDAGYFNIPRELLAAHGIDPRNVECDAYRAWVRERVALARMHFKAGRTYLAQVRNARCRFAGLAYIARFEPVLNSIERDGYRLRRDYGECKSCVAILRLLSAVCAQAVRPQVRHAARGGTLAR
jgi:phytoene/squalene synthetase